MDFLLSILTVIFVGLFIITALTFGFALLVWFIAAALVVTAFIMIRAWWFRFRFLRNNPQPKADQPPLIEGEYEEISNKK